MANLRLRMASIALIVLNFVILILPVVVVYLIQKEADIYALRTALTEKAHLLIFVMMAVPVITFLRFGNVSFSVSTRLVLILEALIGTYLYLDLYDQILVY